jgi:hypothetical protein
MLAVQQRSCCPARGQTLGPIQAMYVALQAIPAASLVAHATLRILASARSVAEATSAPWWAVAVSVMTRGHRAPSRNEELWWTLAASR